MVFRGAMLVAATATAMALTPGAARAEILSFTFSGTVQNGDVAGYSNFPGLGTTGQSFDKDGTFGTPNLNLDHLGETYTGTVRINTADFANPLNNGFSYISYQPMVDPDGIVATLTIGSGTETFHSRASGSQIQLFRQNGAYKFAVETQDFTAGENIQFSLTVSNLQPLYSNIDDLSSLNIAALSASNVTHLWSYYYVYSSIYGSTTWTQIQDTGSGPANSSGTGGTGGSGGTGGTGGTPVPEAASALVLAMALLGLHAARRRAVA